MSAARDLLLLPAFELAVAVARAGEEAVPPFPAPAVLRPFLRFAKVPPKAAAAAERALETDDAFRERVALAATEDLVGRAGWLFVARPDGWEDELDSLVAAREEATAAQDDERGERQARRRLAKAEEATQRAEREAEEARRATARESERAAEAERARRAAEATLADADTRIAAVESRRAEALRRLESAENRVRRLEAELASTKVALEARREPEPEPEPEPRPDPDPPAAEAVPPIDAAALADALREASAALDRAARVLTRGTDDPAPDEGGPEAGGVGVAANVAPAVQQRRPVPLPPAVFDDSAEAAAHLVRTNGVLLLVDGYNVSLAAWPALPLPEQRDRLLAALSALAARTGADVEVVFDGARDRGSAASFRGRLGVRAYFSPADVEADDVLIDRAATVPPHRPLVVASSDRRVQDGVRHFGANVIRANQLCEICKMRS